MNSTLSSTAFIEKKVTLTPMDMNRIKTTSVEDLLLEKAKDLVENKCCEHGFVLPGTVRILSRSMGYFEAARFTAETNYYVKLEAKVIYPYDGMIVYGKVIRKNKMGLYVNYKDAIRIQVPRDLHLGNMEFNEVEVGDLVEVEIKRSKFAINDPFILSSGLFQEILSSAENDLYNANDSNQPHTDEKKKEEDEEEVEAVKEAVKAPGIIEAPVKAIKEAVEDAAAAVEDAVSAL